VTAAVAPACSDILGSSARNPIASISALSLPYPTVVIGDIMRDSLGVATPVSIQAYDANGNIVANQSPAFTILDATSSTLATSVQIDQNGFVHGLVRDTLGARVFASFATLVAPVQRVLVSVAPQNAAKSTATTAINFDTAKVDTSAQTNWSPPLELTLTDANGVGAQGFIITYAVTRSPTPFTAGVPTAYIGDDAGKASARDTTDVHGTAGRRVILRLAAFGDPALLIAGTKTDTVIVRATVKYNGADLSGTPFDYFIPVKKKP
jgi:hypothetical protein